MADAVELKVCIRCRPFSVKDRAGIILEQLGETKGEARIVNAEQERARGPNRYGFAYTWCSAYNYKKFLSADDDENLQVYQQLKQISQEDVYESVGKKMLKELLHGQAVVMFAYGLSGAGKTYTVFGTDDPNSPQAWYKFNRPDENWGLFPRIAYDLLQMAAKHTGWKVRVKYFQNVVDDVKDLLTPQAPSKNYKRGMHVDSHGFMDITWCRSVEVSTWDELLGILNEANSRKSIAPTQFNPSSTRGHCILFYEVDMPGILHEGVTTTARMYVCDLAGAEPAADVHWANYKRIDVGNGRLEYEYEGRHSDKSKTQHLIEQGKKINLSLSEMSLFFRKMSSAMKKHKNKLKPGETVVGCNNYFLGKFLKLTMLKAHTYLFAAVRPELKYQTYTRSTLDFALNASVVKLKPKRMNSHAVLPKFHGGHHVGNNNLSKKFIDLENQHVGALRKEIARLRDKLSGRTPPSSNDIQVAIDVIKRSIILSDEEIDAAIKAFKSARTIYEVNEITVQLLVKSSGGDRLELLKPLDQIHTRSKQLENMILEINDQEKNKYLTEMENENGLSESQKQAVIDAVWACQSKKIFDQIRNCVQRHAEPHEIRDLIGGDSNVEQEQVESLWEAISDKNNATHQQYLDAKEEAKNANEKNGVLSRQNAQQKQHIATLERDVQSYKQQAKAALQAMADESKRTGETNHNLTDKLQKLHDEIHKSNDEASTLKREIEAAHEHEERLLAKRQQAFKNEKIALKAALNNVKKEKERLQREVNEQKRNIETLTEKFHNAQHELKILRVSVTTVKQEKTHEILRRASSQVMSSFQKQKHHKFLEKTKKMESEKQGKIKQLMKDLNAMEEEFKDSEEKNKSLEAELSNLKRKHFKLEADGVKDRTLMNETIESLKRERSKLDDEYNNNIEKLKINLKDTKLNLTKIKKNAEERDRNTLLDNARRDSELEINESKLKALYQDIEKVKLEKANAIHEKDILKQEYEQELATLQNLLSTAQRDSARLHTKCQEIEARNISTIDAKDQEIERQQERVKDMKSAMMQLKQEHENKLFENRKSIDVLKTQLESLQLQRDDYVKNLEKMKENQENAERKAQLEVDSVEKNLTDLVRQRTDQLANKNIELEQIKTQMVQTERMLMDERRSTSKLRHQYEEEKERRLNLLKSHESSSESVQSLLSRLQTQEKEMKGIEVKLKESKRAHETTAKAHLENVRHLKETMRIEKESLLEKCDTFENNLKTCKRELNSAKLSHERLERVTAELAETKHSLRNERDNSSRKEDALNALKKTLESTIETNKHTEDDYYRKCEELRNVREELHKTNQHLTLAKSQSNQKERDAMQKTIDQLRSRMKELRSSLDDQKNQTVEYKDMYEDIKDDMDLLKDSTKNKISEKTTAMRDQMNKETIALRTQLESTKRKFHALSLKFSDVAQEKKEIETEYALRLDKAKKSNEKQIEMMKETLRESNGERDIALEHANEIKDRYNKSVQQIESLTDATNRRDVRILSVEKNREDDAKLIQQLCEHRDNALARNQELEEALAVSQANLDRQRDLCDKLGSTNASYREQDVERQNMIVKCQSMMDNLFNIGIVEAQLLRVARSPRQKRFRSKRGKKMASLVLENSARHMRNLLIEDTASNRLTRKGVKSRYMTPTKSMMRSSGYNRPNTTGRMMNNMPGSNSSRRYQQTSPDLDLNDLRSTGRFVGNTNNNNNINGDVISPHMYNNNNNLADDYADEGIIYTGKAINENLKNLSQSFNVLMRQMNLQEQEI